jgi:hypothetical protein
MDVNLKNELIGRLWLWANSVTKTEQLLELAFRAKIGSNQETQITEMENHLKITKDFCKKEEYDSLHRIYPTQVECLATYDVCVELAIVYFSQIFNWGEKREGEIAANIKSMKEHFSLIIPKIFKTPEELRKFEELKTQIVKVRNEMIGHSDGNGFSVTHGKFVSVLSSTNNWRHIDINFWYSFLDKMHSEMHNYSNKIKLKYLNSA